MNSPVSSNSERSLTDADVEAIVESIIQKFYTSVGKGFMKFVWIGVLAVLMVLASFGWKVGSH